MSQQAFVPICWTTDPGNVSEYSGKWRTGGTGMVALYLADTYGIGFETPGQLPLADRVAWGNEDIGLTLALENSGVLQARECTGELWHIYHGKTKWWDSVDGMHSLSPWKAAKQAKQEGPVDYGATDDWVRPVRPPDGGEYIARLGLERQGMCHISHKTAREMVVINKARELSAASIKAKGIL